MGKLSLTKAKLLKEYKSEVDEIAELLDWKTTFSGEEVCGIVFDILIKHKVQTKLTAKKLYKLYSKKANSLNLSDGEWAKNYGIPEIITMIYNILEENS